ncbi:MAG TPA: tripartite tricarboxylate transporter substrate binding protein [Burkholderiales bacterium]
MAIRISMKWLGSLALVCLGAALGSPASAEDAWPSHPVRLILPFSAGGGTDIFSRAAAQKLTEMWGQSVIVDNRAGANGTIGTDAVAKAAPDGYTLLLTTNATIVINPHLSKQPYDPFRDLAPVTMPVTLPFALVVNPKSPAKTFDDLVKLAREHPGKLNFASSGIGGGAHLAGEMMNLMGKLDTVHVPYKGVAPALTALMAGEVDFMFASASSSTPLVETNRLRILAVSSAKRIATMPDIPAVAEAPGFAGFESDLWYGVFAPAKTDPKIVDKIYRDFKKVIFEADFHKTSDQAGMVTVGNTPAEFAVKIRDDSARWGALIKKMGNRLKTQ